MKKNIIFGEVSKKVKKMSFAGSKNKFFDEK
jgi:hypothetical protein